MKSIRYGRVAPSCAVLLSALCASGIARAQSPNLTLADFEGGKIESVAGLALPVIADEQLGGNSGADLSLVHPGAQGSRNALHISFRMADGFSKPFSSVWIPLGDQGLATDLSAYKGVRFHARGQGGSFVAGIGRFAAGASTRYMVPFELKPEWTLVDLPFDKFAKATPAGKPTPFAPTDVISIGFSVAPELRGQFDLEIDQMEVYK